MTHLDTAYIQPRTLVYSHDDFRTLADDAFDGFQKALIGPAAERLHVRMLDAGVRGRIIDLSRGSARALGMGGTTYVSLRVVD